MSVLGHYPTKKALKEAVGQPLRYEETSVFGPEYRADGEIVVVGPSRENEAWAAQVVMKAGRIDSVK